MKPLIFMGPLFMYSILHFYFYIIKIQRFMWTTEQFGMEVSHTVSSRTFQERATHSYGSNSFHVQKLMCVWQWQLPASGRSTPWVISLPCPLAFIFWSLYSYFFPLLLSKLSTHVRHYEELAMHRLLLQPARLLKLKLSWKSSWAAPEVQYRNTLQFEISLQISLALTFSQQ